MSKKPAIIENKAPARQLWESISREPFEKNVGNPYVLGPYASHIQREDPRHNFFTLARYKFCAKLLVGKKRLLEIGCSDALGVSLVQQEVKPEVMMCVDFDERIIEDNRKRLSDQRNIAFLSLDMVRQKLPDTYDAAYCIDVLEHIYPADEKVFLDHILSALEEQAVFIVGTPNVTANPYASPSSQAGHVNLKDAEALRKMMAERFHNVFMFSMNDEMVHTGFAPMAHYLFAMGVGKR